MKNRFFSPEMASSSYHNNNSIPIATLLEWYKIRDTFFGENNVSQNIPLALELAKACQHPDAQWLLEACAGKDVTTKEDAKRIFPTLDQNDARALCFAWILGDRRDFTPLRRSAELGFAFAQALLAERSLGVEKFKFAQLASAQGERDGFFSFGRCFYDGEGCGKDLKKAKENFLCANKFGDVFSVGFLGDLFDESDVQCWHWWGRAAAVDWSNSFVSNFARQVDLFNSGAGSAAVMFAIGRALQGHVNEEERTIFTSANDFDSLIGPAKQAISFYEAQIKATKDAIKTWGLVGMKFKVVKDVRRLIAKLIWDSREEALFKIQ
jgi:hypothetical protein